MHKVLLDYYNDELRKIREAALDFSKAHPKVASRLRLGKGVVEDPFVGRLVESFSFIAAGLSQKIDTQHYGLNKSVVNVLYPQYLLPFPSCSIIQMQPDEGLDGSSFIERGAEVVDYLDDKTPCRFTTCYPVELLPLEVSDCQFLSKESIGNYALAGYQSCLKVVLKGCVSDVRIKDILGNKLRFYIQAEKSIAFELYNYILHRASLLASTSSCCDQEIKSAVHDHTISVGFLDEESIQPHPSNVFSAFRLLSEYVNFPEKFLFIDITNLDEVVTNDFGDELVLCFYSHEACDSLVNRISADNFQLGCTPVVNIFEQVADPIRLEQTHEEYHLIAHSQQAKHSIEIYSVNDVIASSDQCEDVLCLPMFGLKDYESHTQGYMCWSLNRKSGWEVGDHRLLGYESFLSINMNHYHKKHNETLVLSPVVYCTNRDLPTYLSCSQTDSQLAFWKVGQGDVARINYMTSFSEPKYRDLSADLESDLISLICSNKLSLLDQNNLLSRVEALMSIASYSNSNQPSVFNAITNITSKKVYKLDKACLRMSYLHGIRLSLQINTDAFYGDSVYLFGQIVRDYFAKVCALNNYVEVVLMDKYQNELARW